MKKIGEKREIWEEIGLKKKTIRKPQRENPGRQKKLKIAFKKV